jgi:DNA-binding IscR family transcriptional regulator
MDGAALVASCFTAEDDCSQRGRCSVRQPLRRIHEGMRELLAGISISDMGEEPNLTVLESS